MKKFQIGKLVLAYGLNGEFLIVAPVGDTMVAINVSLFDHDEPSVTATVEIYNPSDIVVVSKVQRWMKEIEEESAIS